MLSSTVLCLHIYLTDSRTDAYEANKQMTELLPETGTAPQRMNTKDDHSYRASDRLYK